MTNTETKATILNDYFVAQCSVIPTGSTLPTFLPRRNPLIEGKYLSLSVLLILKRHTDVMRYQFR